MYKLSDQGSGPSRMTTAFACVAALAYWLVYLLKGKPTFTANDWLKEQVFTNLVCDSIQSWSLPWKMSTDFYHAGVVELIANPEISLTPDMWLLQRFEQHERQQINAESGTMLFKSSHHHGD